MASAAPSETPTALVAAVFREERGRLLAALVRRFGDLDLAEEVASEAVEAALTSWPVDGVPPRPGAWLMTTARRRAIDRLRRDQAYAARLAILQVEQDRGHWDRGLIEEGIGLVRTALTGGPPGPYGVQAAIAALHNEAADVATTDWPQIVALYDVLLALTESPIVAVNRAVAVAMRDGPQAGLVLLDELAGEPLLRDYHPYTVARADLLHRAGRRAEAAVAFRRALDQARTAPERELLRRRLDLVERPGEPAG